MGGNVINLAQLTPIIIESSSPSTSAEQKKAPSAQVTDSKKGELKPDTVTISDTARQQLDISSTTYDQTNLSIDKIANEVVRVSSSIGQAHSQGSLNAEEANKLYHEIAALL
ncbi:hypothetical protein D1819_16660 [Pseudoalteromonas tunicata]|jgi:hypothetical protein|uniref:Uncharacterized protein n=1 Tax=Pseudoalteromonas tunicata D2 TaxID=87626 RepID=A4C815_9GAMM|nr:hypothetical protein D1819_16660 [Pseudoalteromonas tunicata]EAR28730.1 hypothetical protein PTD2_06799 [Pseudoalteromonas tunicata D2]